MCSSEGILTDKEFFEMYDEGVKKLKKLRVEGLLTDEEYFEKYEQYKERSAIMYSHLSKKRPQSSP